MTLGARIDRENRVDRQQVARLAAARQLLHLAFGVLDDDRRLERGAALVAAPVDDDAVGDAGRLVGHFVHRHALDHVLELDGAVDFGHDRAGVGIPLGQLDAALHLVAFVDEQPRAVDHLVHGALVALVVFERRWRRCGP